MSTFTLQDLNLPATADQAVEQVTKEQWMEYGMNNPISPRSLAYATPPTLESVINNICTQLQLLATVIGEQARGNSQNTTPPEGDQSLQDTVELVLKQSDWLKDMVKNRLEAMGIEDIAESVVENLVERDVENYFDTRFDPSEHFDFGDAVADRVDEMLDDVVRERVMDSLEEVVAEKLSEASVSISF